MRLEASRIGTHNATYRTRFRFFLVSSSSSAVPLHLSSLLQTALCNSKVPTSNGQSSFFVPCSICDSPPVKPLQMIPLLIPSLHPENDCTEQHKESRHNPVKHAINRPLHPPILPRQWPRHPINHESFRQDREIQCRVVMVHIRYSRHGDEG